MAAPDAAQQARSYHAEQALLAAAASRSVGGLLRAGVPWPRVLARFARFQLRAASLAVDTMASWAGREQANVDPRPFAGVTSAGFAISEPLIATIDYRVPAPLEEIPAPWWAPVDAEKFIRDVEQLIAAEVQDAARSAAGAEMFTEPTWQNYVRVLVPPSCKRCVVLAGKIYRDLDGFERHPGCDCVHYPVQDWEEAHEAGLVSSPAEAYEKGLIRDLTVAERKAIEDGADITTVINSASGIHTADLLGRRVKATRYGTTRRSAWRRQNPSRLVRLRPETIYRIVDEQYGGDREQARRLLQLYGYLKPEAVADQRGDDAGEAGGTRPPGGSPGPGGQVPEPDGFTVVGRIQGIASTPGGAALRRAESLIDQVHLTPRELPDLPWVDGMLGPDENGAYRTLILGPTFDSGPRGIFRPVDIEIDSNGQHPLLTALHEFGHFIDHQGIGEDTVHLTSGWEYAEGGRLKSLMAALYESEAGQLLRAMRQWKPGLPFGVVQRPDGGWEQFPINAAHVDYLLSGREIFARAYAQWITLRTGDVEARRQLEQARVLPGGRTLVIGHAGKYPAQWGDDDFEPIAAAFDAYFAENLRRSPR